MSTPFNKADFIGAKVAERIRIKEQSENLGMFMRHEPETAYITVMTDREIIAIGYNTEEFRKTIKDHLGRKIKPNKTVRTNKTVYVVVCDR